MGPCALKMRVETGAPNLTFHWDIALHLAAYITVSSKP